MDAYCLFVGAEYCIFPVTEEKMKTSGRLALDHSLRVPLLVVRKTQRQEQEAAGHICGRETEMDRC